MSENRSLVVGNAGAGTQISQTGPAVPAFRNMGEVLEFASVMARGGIAVRKHLRDNPGACAAIILQAMRWDMDPYAVGNKSFAVSDQLGYESQLINAVINTRAPIKGRMKVRYEGEGNTRVCIVSATFNGEDEPTEVKSPKLTDIQPRNSPLWKSDPDQQLAYYTKRAWARRECPEVLLGVYDEEEIQSGMVDGGSANLEPQPRVSASKSALDQATAMARESRAAAEVTAAPVEEAQDAEIVDWPSAARGAAKGGLKAMEAWWLAQANDVRKELLPMLNDLKADAAAADKARAQGEFDAEQDPRSWASDVRDFLADAERAPNTSGGIEAFRADEYCRNFLRDLRAAVATDGTLVPLLAQAEGAVE